MVNSVSDYVKQKAAIPLGLLSIATFLTQNGHTVLIYDRAVEGGSIIKYLDSFSPDIVGISSLGGRSFDDAMKVSKVVRKNKVPVVWGGPMPSLIPEILLNSGSVDYVVMGDGEITFLALINSIINKSSFREIDGLAYLENGVPVINRSREFADLSEFPVIDFSLVDPKKYYFRNKSCNRMLHIYLSKGCPGQCTYCYSPGYSKCIWRSRPTEYVIKELKYLVDNCKMDGVYFVDDLLSPNREYLHNLCNKLIESDLGLFWSCDMRTDTCTKEDLQKMYDSGCRWIFFGVESGSEERQKAIKKRLDLKKVAETINCCREIGIVTTTSFVIGFPDETEEDIMKTIRFMQNLKSDVKIPALFAPLPKSELYYELVKNKRLAAPQSYEEWKKLATIDAIGENFSNVPTKELKVITAYFYLSNMANKNDKDKPEKSLWVRRLFRQAMDMLKRKNLKSLQLLILAAKEFFEILYYANMYSKIRKKYGLNKQ